MVSWTGECGSRGIRVLGVGLALVLGSVGAVTAFLQVQPVWVTWLLLAVAVLVGLAVWSSAALRVVVDDVAFTARAVPLGWPRRRVEWRDVREVSAVHVDAKRWGGWGYRWLPRSRASAYIVRNGPGIQLDLVDGRAFVVTVDDAVAGAQAADSAVRMARRP